MGPQILGDSQQPGGMICTVIALLALLLLGVVHCAVDPVEEASNGGVGGDLKSNNLFLLGYQWIRLASCSVEGRVRDKVFVAGDSRGQGDGYFGYKVALVDEGDPKEATELVGYLCGRFCSTAVVSSEGFTLGRHTV